MGGEEEVYRRELKVEREEKAQRLPMASVAKAVGFMGVLRHD
jgi:hypothetical protein